MESSKIIEHKGVITAIDDSTITVSLEKISACDTCHAKQACAISENEMKTVEIPNPHADFNIGDSVTVILSQSLGYKALFLGYLLPFLIFLVSLIITSNITTKEYLAGAVSLVILAPYYFLLYLNRGRLKETFTFSLKK